MVDKLRSQLDQAESSANGKEQNMATLRSEIEDLRQQAQNQDEQRVAEINNLKTHI